MAARLQAARAGVRPVTVTAPARRAGLACPRLPAAAALATIDAGYLGYALVGLAWSAAAISAGRCRSTSSITYRRSRTLRCGCARRWWAGGR